MTSVHDTAPWNPPNGQDAELLPAGHAWDAVRVPSDIGERALVMLGELSGGVIEDQFGSVLYWLVRPGTADGWHLEQVRVLGEDSFVAVPPQNCCQGLGLRWRIRLSPACYLTPAQILHDALHAAGAECTGARR